jgi:anaerobic selenocysteine-containing dehydrogenase
LQLLGISTDDLRKLPNGYVYAINSEKKYLKHGFSTHSGKVEIYSAELEQAGYEPLPSCHELMNGNSDSITKEEVFPFTLSFGTRSVGYRQSKSPNFKSKMKQTDEPCLEINTNKAGEMGLTEGEKVNVVSSHGSIEIGITFNNEIEPRVVFIPHGWDQANANILTGKGNLDPITGFPLDRCVNVQICKRV